MRRRRPVLPDGGVPARLRADGLPAFVDDLRLSPSARVDMFEAWERDWVAWCSERAAWADAHGWPDSEEARVAEEFALFPRSSPFDPSRI